MNTEIIDVIIKNLILNMFIYSMFSKINGEKSNKKVIIFSSIVQTAFYTYMRGKLNNNIFLVIILSCTFQMVLLKINNRYNKKSIIASVLISNAFIYALFIASSSLEYILKGVFNIQYQTIDVVLTLIIEIIFLVHLLRMKKIKNGISFLKDPISNEYLCVIMIALSAVGLFA